MIGTKRYADEGPKVSDCKRDPRLKIHKEKKYSKNRETNIGYNSKERQKHQKVTQVNCSIKKHQTVNVIHRDMVKMKEMKSYE